MHSGKKAEKSSKFQRFIIFVSFSYIYIHRPRVFYQGFGERCTNFDQEGTPVLVLGGTTRAADVFEKIGSFFADTDTVLCSNRFASKYTEAHTASIQLPCFQQGRALFYVSGVLRLFQLREVEMDFGVLPMPKYDEKQES